MFPMVGKEKSSPPQPHLKNKNKNKKYIYFGGFGNSKLSFPILKIAQYFLVITETVQNILAIVLPFFLGGFHFGKAIIRVSGLYVHA